MRYTHIFIILLVILQLVGCRSTTKESQLKLSEVKKFCSDPHEVYPLRVVGIPFALSVYKKCASHNELLTVAWSTDREYLTLETLAAELVVGAYARFRSDDKTKCLPNHMNFEIAKDGEIATYFHTITCNDRIPNPNLQLKK